MDVLIKLTNPPFDLEWNGETLQVHKANLQKVAMFKARAQELVAANDIGVDQKLTAYCIWLTIKDAKPGITEDDVLNAASGNLDFKEVTIALGFLSPTKVEVALESQTKTTEDSSSS